jgi:hypothetical protein
MGTEIPFPVLPEAIRNSVGNEDQQADQCDAI